MEFKGSQGVREPSFASPPMHFESELVYNPPHPQAHFHVVNPGMRYDSSHPSYHFPTSTTTATRQHTPPPIDSQQFHSRSCSSPGATTNTTSVGVIGPTRTTRTRRTSSFGSTSSPPPLTSAHFTARPQAIVIPRSSNSHSHASGGLSMSPLSPMSPTSPISSASASSTNHGQGHGHGGWYNMPTTSPDFALAEPSHSSGGGYNTELYLPPVSALQHHPHSSSKSDHFISYANGSNNGVNNGTGMMNGISGVSGINGINGLSSFNGSPVPLSMTTPSLGLDCGFGVKTKKNGVTLTSSTRTRAMAGSTTTTRLLTAQENQALIANEKRRRRRESHNAVERRRRDNINERISELATLIPECMLEVSGTNPIPGTSEEGGDGALPSPLEASTGLPQDASSAKKEDSDAGSGGAMKANKGMILRKSVEYIRYLQQLASVQGTRNRELEAELKAYKTAAGVEGQSNSCSSPCSSSPSPLGSSVCSVLASTSTSSPATDAEEKSKDWSRQSPPCNMTVNGLDSRSSSANGFGSFGGLFPGLPSMPAEASSAEDHDMDMCGLGNEKSGRGRTRVQCHGVPAPQKIKEELDLILMEA